MDKNINNRIQKPTVPRKNKARLKKLDINELDDSFVGIAYSKNKTYLVKNVLEGERVEVELPCLKNKEREKNYIHTPRRIITASDDRVPTVCSYINSCGNCKLLHCRYEAQIQKKTNKVNAELSSAGLAVSSFTQSRQTNCRNKVHLAFTDDGKRTVVGFFNEETRRVVPVQKCHLHGDWFEKLVSILNKWATDNKLTAFKPWAKSGILRFAVCRYLNGNIMLTIVSRENIRCMNKLYNELCKSFQDVSLYLNINTQENSKVFSDKFIHINSSKKLSGKLLGIDIRLSPNSFFQVNEYIAEKIYSTVLDEAKKAAPDVIIDAYSGIGITSTLFAANGYNVTSIEIVPKAVEDAKELAKLNRIEHNINFICGDCNNILPKLTVSENSLFFVDPPRSGLGAQVCNSIIKFKPKHIIYLSCDIHSLHKDIDCLKNGGYFAESIQLFDMFPNTKHIEALVCIKKQ